MTLKYPSDMLIEEQTDYIMFQFYTYKPPFQRGGSGSDVNSYNQSGGNNDIAGNFGEQVGEDIILYMPEDVSTTYAATWGGKEVSNLGAGALSGVANATNGNLGGLMSNFGAGLESAEALPTTAGAGLLRMALSNLQSNLEINDILGGTQGVILNPNVELFFGGPQIRNVAFKFKMFAKSTDDATAMHSICTAFKVNSVPGFGGNTKFNSAIKGALNQIGNAAATGFDSLFGGTTPDDLDSTPSSDGKVGNFIRIPNIVKMQLKRGGKKHPFLSQYKSLAITNVDINYTPDGSYAPLIDGFPSAVELKVSFVETKIVYQEDFANSGWSY